MSRTTASVGPVDRESIDQMARDVVLEAYRQTDLEKSSAGEAFEAALAAYQRCFPSVPKALAQQAVLFIIDSDREPAARN